MSKTRLQMMRAVIDKMAGYSPTGMRELLDLAELVRVYIVKHGAPRQGCDPQYREMHDAFMRFIQS